MNRRVVLRLLLVPSFLILTSCGGSNGGGVAEFKTVTVAAQCGTVLLQSDVVTGNTCPTPNPPDGKFVTETVDVTITSTVYPNFGGTNTSPVEIDGYTIRYTPANSVSPALPDLHGTTIGQTVLPGGTLTLSIPVAQDSLKFTLVNSLNLQLCSATMYQYFVTITFVGLETHTGTSSSFETSLNVAFADRNS